MKHQTTTKIHFKGWFTQKPKGFSLIKLVMALSFISLIIVILTPLILSYLSQSRVTRAEEDIRAIARAIRLYKRDTGQFPIYHNQGDARADTESISELLSPGKTPSTNGGGTGWEFDKNGSMETLFNTNLLQLPTNSLRGEQLSYQGPYMQPINSDPWGNAYVITAVNLLRSSRKIGFVISSGPNLVLDTDRDQTGFIVVQGDDIVMRVR